MTLQMFSTKGIVGIGNAVFRDFDRDVERGQEFNRPAKAFSVHWVAEFGEDLVPAFWKTHVSQCRQRKTRQDVRVIVEAHKIEAPFRLGNIGKEHPAVLNSASPRTVPEAFQETSEGPIDGAPTVLWIEQRHVLRHPNLGFRLLLFESSVDMSVR